MDYYLNPDNEYQRLEDEYLKYGRLIICVDYDDTLFDFHKLGRTYDNMIDLLKRWNDFSDIIINTGNGEDQYESIKQYCKEHGLAIYGVNCESRIKVSGPKIFASVYLDDRGGLAQTYNMLLKLIDKIENKTI